MRPEFHKKLLAIAIAALVAAPAFATTDKAGAQVPAKTEAAQARQQQPGQATRQKSQDAILQQTDNLIYSWSADALRGKEVVDEAGNDIGKVENVLLAPDRRSIHAVITMGGIVGIGSREVLVSLDELRAVDDKLQMRATKEQINALPDYPPQPYKELKGDSPLIGQLVDRPALGQGRSASVSTTASMTQQATEQPGTGRQMGATPQATARTGSVPPAARTDATSSSPSATSQRAVDVAQPKDASKSAEASAMAAQERSSTERSEAASAETRMTENPLYSRSADNLNGAKVVDRARNDVGKVVRVVLTPDYKAAFVVIDIGGGFLGMGARSIVVSLNELEAVDDGLMMSATKESVEAHRDYSSEHYVELKGNRPISGAIAEFAAFEPEKDASKPAGSPAAPKRGQ